MALVGAARSLLAKAIDPLSKGLEELGEAKGRGGRHSALVWVKKIGYEESAFIVARAVLEKVSLQSKNNGRKVRLTDVALDVTDRILNEIKYRRFQEAHPYLFLHRLKKLSSTTNYKHRRRSFNALVTQLKLDVGDLELGLTSRLAIGSKLVALFAETTQLVSFETVATNVSKRKTKKNIIMVVPPETVDWMRRKNGALQFLRPVFRPLVIPPKPWAPKQRGGYWYAMQDRFPMVKRVSKKHLSKLDAIEMPQVYEALNALQETPWKINQDVYGLLKLVRDNGLSLLDLLPQQMPLPPKPPNIAEDEDARKAWRKEAGKVKDENYQRKLKALDFSRTLYEAEDLGGLERFYYTWSLDFRGRIYPVASYIQPQASDLGKSLLTFADPKPIGEEGIGYLAVHGMNMLGDTPEGAKVSALTIQERVDWIVNHTKEIQDAARDPFLHDWWTVADKPLQFYAFCCEWDRLIAAVREGTHREFLSALPVAQDGSCNGVQHFAAMLRDVETGLSVNLIARTIPHDLYASVADQVGDVVESDAPYEILAALWLGSGLLGRKLSKRPTMTFGYGSREYGFSEQLQEYVKELIRDGRSDLKDHFVIDGVDHLKQACHYLAKVLWEALRLRASAAFNAMEWMRRVTKISLTLEEPVEWTVPGTGFLVRQEYFDTRPRQIETVLNGKILKPSVAELTSDVSKHKQRNAVAPNFIHSLDAAVLMRTVLKAKSDGVRHFGMVHDSYATVAGDMPKLARATRESFVEFYESYDPLDLLLTQMKALSPEEEFPPPPVKGDLDIRGVLESAYFFA